jgi:hypothetical protein
MSRRFCDTLLEIREDVIVYIVVGSTARNAVDVDIAS